MTSRTRLLMIMLFMLFSMLFSLSHGSISLPFNELFLSKNALFLKLRLPRTLTALTCGGLLGLAGTLMQLLLENPLADPYALGISGGAAFITLLLMLCGVSDLWLMGGAWLGSLFTIILILALTRHHRFNTHGLLLCGMALAFGFSAGISIILIKSPNAQVPGMLFWLSGDLNDTRFHWFALFILCIGFIICWMLAPGFNLLSRGDKPARALGLPSTKYRIALYLLSSLFTATAVSLSGCIGFIGLIIPHLSRMIIGFDHRLSVPTSLLLGAGFLTLADTFARSVFAPVQLPVGILLAVIGVPIFIWLLSK